MEVDRGEEIDLPMNFVGSPNRWVLPFFGVQMAVRLVKNHDLVISTPNDQAFINGGE